MTRVVAEPRTAPDTRSRFARLPGAARAALWMVAGALVAVLVVAGAAAVAWPLLEQRSDWVADWLGEQLGHRVDIREMELAWQGAGPVVRLRGLRIETGDPDSPTLDMDAAEVRVDALGSLRQGALRPRSVTVRGATLEVQRTADGGIAVAGFGLDAARRADRVLVGLTAGLPAGAVLSLEETRLTLRGLVPGAPAAQDLVLDPVSLHLLASGEGLRLSGALIPDRQPGASLRFALRWKDRAAHPLDAANLTINARQLALSALPPGLVPWPVAGRLDLEVEARLASGQIESMRGTTVLREVRLGAGSLEADSLESLLDFQRSDGGWSLTLLRLRARDGARQTTPARVTVSREATDPDGLFRAGIDHVTVETLLDAIAHLADADVAASVLTTFQPRGHAQDLELLVRWHATAFEPVSLSADLKGVVLQSSGATARLGPADLRIRVDNAGGGATLAPAPVFLDDAPQAPLEFAAGGAVAWRIQDSELHVSSDGINLAADTSRLRLTGDLWVPLDAQAATRVAVSATGSDFDAARVKRYLARMPSLPEALATWLQGAIHDGRVSHLDLAVDGPLDALSRLDGTLQATARFEGVELEYARGWPMLENLSGEVTLSGARFDLSVDDGSVAGARIVAAKASVADVTDGEPLVSVDGQVRGLTQQGAAFLADTPMGSRFAGLLKQLDARGKAALALKLDIPLGARRTRVEGEVELAGNTLKVGGLRTSLEQVSGNIRFDRDGLRDGALEAHYLGRRIKAAMDGTRDNRERTRLTIDGTTDPTSLVRHLHDVGALDSADPKRLSLLSRLSGATRWQVVLDMAHREPLSGDGIALSVRSDLEGMALALPPPLGKRSDERRTLEVSTRLTESGPRLFRIRYGDGMAALLERDASAGRGFRLRRGAVRFGGEPELPAGEGLRVSGAVDLLSVDGWVALIADAAGAGSDPESPLARVNAVDVRARRLVALGAGFDDVQVKVTQDAAGRLRIAALGESVDGTIVVPIPVGSAPIDARFRTLVVTPDSDPGASMGARGSRLDPRTLPDARVVAERLAYGDVELGLAKLSLHATETGLELSELFTLNQNFELRGSGSWTDDGAASRSRFDLRIHSTDFGELSKVLGYGDSGAEGGVTDVSLQASWNGTPFDFALDRVQGMLHFRATEGRLRDVEPGATGRVFGLLNVAVLPRRLLYLDFNDLFEEGIRYDLIEGSFTFDGGNAYSDNISMHTQSARIDLSGRVGLVAEDFDQVMTVTPKLSASLPLAPLWLAEKFLNRKLIDAAFAYRYLISGSWDDPKVERIQVKAERSDAG